MCVLGLPGLPAGSGYEYLGRSWHVLLALRVLGLCPFPASLDLSCSTDYKLCECRSHTRPIFIFSVASGMKFGTC